MVEIDSRMKKTIKTYDLIAQTYFGKTFNLNVMDMSRKKYLNFLVNNPGCGVKILDIGCGSGRDSREFNYAGLDCVGIDLSFELIKLAKKHVNGVEFCVANMLEMPFEKNTFDGLWACASLLHVPHHQKHLALCEFKRVSKPGGLLYLSVKEGNGEEYLFSEKYGRQARHFSYYTMSELVVLLKQHDFEIFHFGKKKWQTDWIFAYAQLKK